MMTPKPRKILLSLAVVAVALSGCASPSTDSDPDDQDSDPSNPGSDGTPGTDGESDATRNLTSDPIEKDYTARTPQSSIHPPMNAGCPTTLNPGGPENFGGACFEVPDEVTDAAGPNATIQVHLEITDDSGYHVGAWVQFFDDDGQGSDDSEDMCNEEEIALSDDTDWVSVAVDGSWCIEEFSPFNGAEPFAATTGTITATFSVTE